MCLLAAQIRLQRLQTMNQRILVRKILMVGVLVVFWSCASPAKEKRLASGGPTAGARIGKGAVDGLRYVVGAPFFLAMAILGPLGGASPSVGLGMLQQLHDYELPEESPKPTSYIELPRK